MNILHLLWHENTRQIQFFFSNQVNHLKYSLKNDSNEQIVV